MTDSFVADAGSEPMQSVDRVETVEGGLRGDRYCEGRGHYAPFDVCEVALIASEDVATSSASRFRPENTGATSSPKGSTDRTDEIVAQLRSED